MRLITSLSYVEKLFFAKHLSMFLKSGIPLNEALEFLAQEKTGSQIGEKAAAIQRQVENGVPLHQALAKDSRSFDPLFTSMVEIGEASGTLDKSLDYLAEKLSREEALRKKITSMLYYPALVMGVAVAIGAFVSFFVLPKLGTMFRSFQIELPWPTVLLLWIAEKVKTYGFALLVSIFSLVIAFKLLVEYWMSFRFWWHRVKLSLPVVGPVFSSAALAAFFRNLGVMMSSGLSLHHALKTESMTADNLMVRYAAGELKKYISQGQKLESALQKLERKVFPSMCGRLIAAGEASGKLEETFFYLADYFQDETEVRSKNAAVFLEPALLLLIAVVVGFVALAVILPIYSLSGSIHK